ncbi:MAG: hypothetical protein KAH18_06535 [Psychromonas sp.]|nr:hypothetical protein [Psychromonas sp.]
MKNFIILLLTLGIYIPCSYADNITVCTTPNSITTGWPKVELEYFGQSLTTNIRYALPPPGECATEALYVETRLSLVGKSIDVTFTVGTGTLKYDIGNVTFNSVADFDQCHILIEYLNYASFTPKARASKACTSTANKTPFKLIHLAH